MFSYKRLSPPCPGRTSNHIGVGAVGYIPVAAMRGHSTRPPCRSHILPRSVGGADGTPLRNGCLTLSRHVRSVRL